MGKSAFDVYSTSTGLKQISNPVRQRILIELQQKDLSLTEIAKVTQKAQSTLSVHLDKMVKEGLVDSRDDPNDNRRKIFFLVSNPVGSTIVPKDGMREAVGQAITDSIGEPARFLKGMIRSIICGIESIGFNMDPVLRDIGVEIGKAISEGIESERIEDVISEAQEFYELHDMGEVCVYSFVPLTIIIRDDYDCSAVPEVGNTLCAIHEGIIRSILESCTKRTFNVTTTECFGVQNNYSKFIMLPELQ